MNIDAQIIQNELKNLNTDKGNISNAVVALKSQLEEAENKLLSIDGAIRTCEYFLKLAENQNESNGEKEEEKEDQETSGVDNG